MHIMYTVDKKYANIMLTSMYSLIENGGLESIHFHIVTAGFDEETTNRVSYFLSKFPNVTFTFYKLEDYPIDNYGIPSWRGTQIANARLFFPKIIREKYPNIKNILYIDSDTLVKNSLNGLEAYDDHAVCAAREGGARIREYKERLGLDKYYNSGVIYLNLEKWASLDFEHEMKVYNPQAKFRILYPDQDIFNLVLRDEIQTIPSRYNLSPYPFMMNPIEMKLFYKKRQLTAREALEEKRNAVILHSIGLFNIKPWYRNNINPMTKDFEEYMRRIDPEYQLEELSRMKRILTFSPALFKAMLITKANFPEPLNDLTREISLKMQKARDSEFFKRGK